MSRISKKFKQLKKERRKALIPFITAGDPSLARTEKLILTLEEAGADIIELGVPFSDPMADGPVIQASSERALKKGANLNKILKLVSRVRKKTQIPIVLMGYYNPVFVMGISTFAKKAAEAGVDGVLTVDLPPEEAYPLAHELKKNRIDPIFLLAPTSTLDRIRKAAHLGSGFLYYVSMTGITGAKLSVTDEIQKQVRRIRSLSSLPVAVGFGISHPHQAAAIKKMADGVVIGSALIRILSRNSPSLTRQVYRFISTFNS